MKLDEIRNIHDAYSWLATVVPAGSNYLEIGVCDGNSLIKCVQTVAPASVTLCDSWGSVDGGSNRGTEAAHAFITSRLADANYHGDVKFIDGNTQQTLFSLVDPIYDLALVDGEHSERGAFSDFMHAYRLLRPGGYLLFDDLDHPQHSHLRRVWQIAWSGVAAKHILTTLPHNGTYGCGICQKPALQATSK